MKSIRFGPAAFYMLEEGERLTESDLKGSYSNFYIIWPIDSKWHVRFRHGSEWIQLSDKPFDSENEAFNYCHHHYVEREEEADRRLGR